MTGEQAMAQLGRLARARAFGRNVGSDQLIQAGPDALRPIVHCAISLAGQDDNRNPSFEALRLDALQAARDLLGHRPPP
jgi:hypothetical protein